MRFIIFGFLLALVSCSPQPHQIGGTAPSFELKDVAGKVHSLSQYKGKVVLLHFWTDFCKSCKVEFPKLQGIYQELKGDNFEMLAINLGQSAEVSKKFQQDYDATFPMLLDKHKATQDLYNIKVYPTNVFINPEGKIVRIIRAWVDIKQVRTIVAQNAKGEH